MAQEKGHEPPQQERRQQYVLCHCQGSSLDGRRRAPLAQHSRPPQTDNTNNSKMRHCSPALVGRPDGFGRQWGVHFRFSCLVQIVGLWHASCAGTTTTRQSSTFMAGSLSTSRCTQFFRCDDRLDREWHC